MSSLQVLYSTDLGRWLLTAATTRSKSEQGSEPLEPMFHKLRACLDARVYWNRLSESFLPSCEKVFGKCDSGMIVEAVIPRLQGLNLYTNH